jgi:hypothetical protein
MAHRLTS